MGGVDTLDMLVSMHPIPFKSKRWYTRIIWRIFDLMIINSWILMKHGGHAVQYGGTSQGSFRLFHFKSEIAKVLLKRTKLRQLPSTSNDLTSQESDSDNEEEDETPTKKPREIATSVPQSTRYDGVNHWPIFVSGINKTRCKNEKCSMKTYWKCSKCNMHLCLNSNRNCFTQYHGVK